MSLKRDTYLIAQDTLICFYQKKRTRFSHCRLKSQRQLNELIVEISNISSLIYKKYHDVSRYLHIHTYLVPTLVAVVHIFYEK